MADKTYGRVYPNVARVFEIETNRGRLPLGNDYADSIWLAGGNLIGREATDRWWWLVFYLKLSKIQGGLNWTRNRGFGSLGEFVREEREELRLLEKQSRLWAYALKKIDKINRNRWRLDYAWMRFTQFGEAPYEDTAEMMLSHLMMVGSAIIAEGVIKGEIDDSDFFEQERLEIPEAIRRVLEEAGTEKFSDGVAFTMAQHDEQVSLGPEMDKFDPQANPFRDYLLKLARYVNNNAGVADVAMAAKVVREKFNAAMKKSG